MSNKTIINYQIVYWENRIINRYTIYNDCVRELKQYLLIMRYDSNDNILFLKGIAYNIALNT